MESREPMYELSLNGAWQVHRMGEKDAFAGRVPGCIHTDLLAAGRIPDPFYRDNEAALQWIGEAGWVYSRTFEVPVATLAMDRVLLRCEGLDTLAELRINGRRVGRADNMYRIWEFDIKKALRPGRNMIEVAFASALPVMARKQAERPLPGWPGPREPLGRAYIRKEPCNCGWDWGPILVTCGIWKSISVVAFSRVRLKGLQVRQIHARGRVRISVTPELERLRAGVLTAQVRVRFKGKIVASSEAVGVRDPAVPIQVVIAHPELWWPNGMGSQPLYTVELELWDELGHSLGLERRTIGLRTLRLDRHTDAWGESFQFVVNGIPFFVKGGNWIPADAFATRVDYATYARLLQDMVAANMNMVRVWGGGIYENNEFYDLCDELGLCVWQDFMFAGSTYPTFDDAFLTNFKVEAEENIRRLRHHACIALWCGNNEIEMGMAGDEWTPKTMSWKDYGRLFDDLLPRILKAEDPDRDYWPCSPHSPHGDRHDHANPKWGDAHLWAVWHGRQPFEWYRTCEHRFNSEFGFQSFPEPRTVKSYTAPQDRNITTRVMEFHQRSGIGNAVIMQYMLDWYRLPSSFENTLWLSQILQGMAMKYAVEHWRRSMPRGMGTLYWQINDCWPVASWSSIDYQGRWKALHYMARHFYQPVLASGLEDPVAGTVALHVTNDLTQAVTGRLSWTVTDLSGRNLLSGSKRVKAMPLANTAGPVLSLRQLVAQQGAANLLVWIDFKAAGGHRSRNLVLFARPKHMDLPKPRIKVALRDRGDGMEVTLTSKVPALWVWIGLEKHEARYSDNFIHLKPGQPGRIIVSPAAPLSRAAFRKELTVKSLIDTY